MFDEAALLYAERPEWKDITPIQQYEGDANPIAPILYTAECVWFLIQNCSIIDTTPRQGCDRLLSRHRQSKREE